MKKLGELYLEVWRKERGVFLLMGLMSLVAVVMAGLMTINLRAQTTVVKVGYSDLKGYQEGNWKESLVLPLMVMVIGVMHNLLAARIAVSKGAAMAKVFIGVSFAILGVVLLVFLRLLEGR